jgi:hypothetical protein
MIDETYRARWAWLFGSLASVVSLVLACSANDPEPGDGDGGSGGSAGAGANGGVAPTGGAGANGGVAGSVAPGGTGSGGVSGAATGGVATGGVSGANTGGAPGGVGGTPGTGGAGGVGGTSGTSGGGATLVEPILRGSNYVLEFGDLYFEVSPTGARVVNVHLTGGQNLLTDSTINAINYGSTFWTSPQAAWNPNWPPVPEIDSGAYTPTVASPAVSFLGPAATRIPARVAKTFTADLQRVAVVAEYAVQATGAGQSFAPWEITRVFKRGITFWPTGTAPRAIGSMALPPTMDAAGCTWHQAPTANGADQKLFANASAGWLAHVDGDIVIVKKFPDIMPSQAAPNEDEIEVYVSGAQNYIEVEQQGAYQAVAMGEDFRWTVTWFVRRLPAGVTATVGNQQLVSFVQSLVQ